MSRGADRQWATRDLINNDSSHPNKTESAFDSPSSLPPRRNRDLSGSKFTAIKMRNKIAKNKPASKLYYPFSRLKGNSEHPSRLGLTLPWPIWEPQQGHALVRLAIHGLKTSGLFCFLIFSRSFFSQIKSNSSFITFSYTKAPLKDLINRTFVYMDEGYGVNKTRECFHRSLSPLKNTNFCCSTVWSSSVWGLWNN